MDGQEWVGREGCLEEEGCGIRDKFVESCVEEEEKWMEEKDVDRGRGLLGEGGSWSRDDPQESTHLFEDNE